MDVPVGFIGNINPLNLLYTRTSHVLETHKLKSKADSIFLI